MGSGPSVIPLMAFAPARVTVTVAPAATVRFGVVNVWVVPSSNRTVNRTRAVSSPPVGLVTARVIWFPEMDETPA